MVYIDMTTDKDSENIEYVEDPTSKLKSEGFLFLKVIGKG